MTKSLALVFLLAMATVLSAQQSATTPAAQDTAASRQFIAWLAAFNSGDRATLLAYLEKYRPSRADKVDDLLGFRQQTGGFVFKKTEESTATRYVALVKEHDSDQFARLVMEVAAEEPHVITTLEINAIPTPPDLALSRMTEAQAIAATREEVEKTVAADHFSGSVIVAKNGKHVFAQAYGLADREKKIPNQLGTRFRIGSMNKMFTAVAIMELVQAGKIKLTDPLGKFLPDYANKDVASKVTVHHLLTHTGGTGDFFGPEFDAHRLELRTLQDYVKLYEKRALAFEPGSRWEYSNFGFLLLGVIVEKASGQDYYDYVREHVFKPAGMTSTDSLPESESVPGRSVGYMREDSPDWKPNTDTLPWRGTSAGGGYSTVEDLQHFAEALQNHRLLDAQHTDLLTTGKVDSGRSDGSKYAYGFMDSTENGVRCFGHGGGAPGMNGELKICPQTGYVIAVLANVDPPAAQRVAGFLASRLPAQ